MNIPIPARLKWMVHLRQDGTIGFDPQPSVTWAGTLVPRFVPSHAQPMATQMAVQSLKLGPRPLNKHKRVLTNRKFSKWVCRVSGMAKWGGFVLVPFKTTKRGVHKKTKTPNLTSFDPGVSSTWKNTSILPQSKGSPRKVKIDPHHPVNKTKKHGNIRSS